MPDRPALDDNELGGCAVDDIIKGDAVLELMLPGYPGPTDEPFLMISPCEPPLPDEGGRECIVGVAVRPGPDRWGELKAAPGTSGGGPLR